MIFSLFELLPKVRTLDIRDNIRSTDIAVIDRLLNTLMRGADVACQVSTREGFEIKVRAYSAPLTSQPCLHSSGR